MTSVLSYVYAHLESLIPFLPLLLFVYLVATRSWTWYRLRHFPGPFLGKFTYAFMAKTAASGRMNDIYTEVSRNYGPLAQVGPNDLVTDDPDIIKKMSSARSTYTRSSWYAAMRLNPGVDHLISEMDVPTHDARRAKMASAYNGKENTSMENDIDACIANWISLIRRKYISNSATTTPMDFAHKAQYFTMDTITKVAYGEDMGFLTEDKDLHDYVKKLETTVPYLSFLAVVPVLSAILNSDWMKRVVGPAANDKSGFGQLMGVAQRRVAERFDDNKIDKRDMLGAFVRSGLPQQQVEAEVLLQIIAGSDTTATSIRATMLYLLASPRVLVKLRAEIDEAVKTGRISNPVTNAESKTKLPYLQAVIKEGVRIHPPFTGLVMKKVPSAGDMINGRFVPGGTRIGHSIWALLHRKDIFGHDAEVFRPERWLEADEAGLLRMEQGLDLLFGHGRWTCLGKSIAYLELNKVFVQLLRNFEFELLTPGKPWKSANFNLFLQGDMWVRISERDGMY